MCVPCFLILGPLGETEQIGEMPSLGGDLELEYKGFRLLAWTRKAAAGWIGELMIISQPVQLPVQGYCSVPRFHMDPMTALQEALLYGIMRVERGEVFAL